MPFGRREIRNTLEKMGQKSDKSKIRSKTRGRWEEIMHLGIGE